MRAAVLEELETLRIVEKPIPKVETDRVLIKVRLCGICGTDFHFVDGRAPVELPYHNLGHEYVGTIEKVGENVRTLSLGDRVVINPNYHCDNCYYCQCGKPGFCENRRALKTKSNGGFADYTCIAEKHVYRVPASLSDEQAIFAEPLSCCLHAVEQLDLKAGDDVLIYGGGTMGLLMLQLCRLKGASKIIVSEPIALRRRAAQQLGADTVVNPLTEKLKDVVTGMLPRGPQVVIESAGAKNTLAEGLELIDYGGQFVLLASWGKDFNTEIPPGLLVKKEVSIFGAIFGYEALARALNLLASQQIKISGLLTDVFKLEDLTEAINKAKGPNAIKVAVQL